MMWFILLFVFAQGEDFLRNAEITATGKEVGSTNAQVVELEWKGEKAKGLFKTIDNGEDSYHNEVLAYRIGKLLGFNIPPVVYREDYMEGGSLQLWVEGCITLDEDVEPLGMTDDNQTKWDVQAIRAFDRWIRNPDRHGKNILICEGELVLIDHSRAFSRKWEVTK